MSTELIPALRQKRGVGTDAAIYQQDASLEYLHRYLHEYRFISRRTERPLPAYSPHLSHLDCFLWRYLSDRVNSSNRQTIDAQE